jgi:hypothetical protein
VPLSVKEYDRLERAIIDRKRVALRKGGREYLVIPERLRLEKGREVITTRHPSTGYRMEIFVDELEGVELVA